MKRFSISVIVLLLGAMPTFVLAEEEEFSDALLDQMLAPIALYPDVLLSQILMASTYPLEIVEAARWSANNPGMEGEEAVDAVADKDWDPSVQALVAFPSILERMSDDLSWTRRLGDAFLLQEEQVLERIQELRGKAYAAGALESLDNLTVSREREVIVIEPAKPEIVYVPYYSTRVIYGNWWHPAYPPVYWGPPYGYAYTHSRIIYTRRPVYVSSGFFFSTFDWPRRQIVIVNVHNHYPRPGYDRTVSQVRRESPRRWQHDPTHRRGVDYRSDRLTREFGRSTATGISRGSVVSRDFEREREIHQQGQQRALEALRRDRERAMETLRSPRERTAESLSRDRERTSEILRREGLSRDTDSVRRPGDFTDDTRRPIPGRDAYGREIPNRSSATRGLVSGRDAFGREVPDRSSVTRGLIPGRDASGRDLSDRGVTIRSRDPRSGVSTDFRDRVHSSGVQRELTRPGAAGRTGESDRTSAQERGTVSRPGIERFQSGVPQGRSSVTGRDSGRGSSLGLEVPASRATQPESRRGAATPRQGRGE